MARRRYQRPKPFRSGRWWYLLYWTDEFENGRLVRKRTRFKLAGAETPERQVQKLADEHLRPTNQGLTPITAAMRFNDYVETAYKTDFLPLRAKSTRARYEGIIRNYLVPAFGAIALKDLTLRVIQNYFSTQLIKAGLSFESQDKIRDVLAAILGTAVRYGFLTSNPAEGVAIAATRIQRAKPYLDPQKFQALLSLLHEPYATMVYVALYSGLRPSELIALRWKNVLADSIVVEEKYCRGEEGPPKSKASNAAVAVPHQVIARIHHLKTITLEIRAGNGVRRYPAVKSGEPEDRVFQSPLRGIEMSDANILRRHIKPAGRKLGMPWLNWQALRRSYATWLKLAGADPKDAQAQMRHSRVTTTLEIYQQHVPESQRRAVDKLGQLTVSGLVN